MYKKQIIYVKPTQGTHLASQIEDCLALLTKEFKTQSSGIENIIKQTVFIKAKNNTDFKEKKLGTQPTSPGKRRSLMNPLMYSIT